MTILRNSLIGDIDIAGSDQEKYAEDLRRSRLIVKTEIGLAMQAKTPEEKREIVARWKAQYSKIMADQLLTLARSKHAKEISDWRIE